MVSAFNIKWRVFWPQNRFPLLRNTRYQVARILVAKPVPVFAEYAPAQLPST
jgi:hypothetical protein